MGACLSCVGLGRHEEDLEPSETERLLYEDNESDHRGYGTASSNSRLHARDPEEIRRQREMLEAICSEAANNLIDVHDTALLTLRGKPSNEFAALLNSHFRSSHPTAPSSTTDQDPASSTTDNDNADPTPLSSAPHTPDPNRMASSPPEPPSPFTQAQIAAQSSRNGNTKHHHSLSGGLSHFSHAHSTAVISPGLPRARDHSGFARQLAYGGNTTPGSRQQHLPSSPVQQASAGAEQVNEDEEAQREAAWLAEVTREMGTNDPAAIRTDATQSLIVDLGPPIRNDDDVYDDDEEYSDSDHEEPSDDLYTEHVAEDGHGHDEISYRHPFARAEAGMDHRGQAELGRDEQDEDERGYEFVPRREHDADERRH